MRRRTGKRPRVPRPPCAPGLCAEDQCLLACAHERSAITHLRPPKDTKISTMVAIGRLDVRAVDYRRLCEAVNASPPFEVAGGNRATSAKLTKFAGQCSVVVAGPALHRPVNIKAFHTGSLQLSGVCCPASGIAAMRVLRDVCVAAGVAGGGATPADSEAEAEAEAPPTVSGYTTVNMNSTHKLGYEVNRDRLFHILKGMGLLVLYDSTHYPGVNLKYLYNTENPRKDGICHCYDRDNCDSKCIAVRGSGNALRQCRPVTVSVYNSGSILITGTRNYRQLHEVFKFITRVCRDHRSAIEAQEFDLAPTDDVGF